MATTNTFSRWIAPFFLTLVSTATFIRAARPPAETEPDALETTAPAEEEPSTATTGEAAAAESPADKPRRGPKFLDLRYNEDFRYLEGEPESIRKDLFDPVKNIRLGADWRLTLGGEFRIRVESETNRRFGATEPAQDTFVLQRYLLHADLKYRDLFRIFVQGITAFEDQRDLPPRPTDENKWDLHQFFVDFRVLGETQPWTVRVGRQELSYGAERLVSTLDWANVRRRFDAVKLFARYDKWDFDVFYARPDIVDRSSFDNCDENFDFYGGYITYKGLPRHGIDAYVFAVHDENGRLNPNGRTGDRHVYTVGSRFWGKSAGFDYEAEVAGQWGRWAGDTVQAWAAALDGGYTLAKVPWSPRLGAGFDWATGDDDPRDGSVQTFDQLFPLGHKYFGYLDLIGRQNVVAANVNLSAWPISEKVKAAAFFHLFWLDSERDALYDAGGAVVRRDPQGRSGKEIGRELDLTITWQISPHSTLLLGYSHFWADDFLQETGPSQDADLIYLQYAFKF